MRTYLVLTNKPVSDSNSSLSVRVERTESAPGIVWHLSGDYGEIAVLVGRDVTIGQLGEFLADLVSHLFYVIRDIEVSDAYYQEYF